MITYQQQLQQQQFIQFLNNLPQLAELFLVGNDTILSPIKSVKNVSEEKAKMKLNQ